GFTSGAVIITDLQGIEVLNTGRIPLPITLQLDDMPVGMYICTVQEADGKMTSMKVVKGE
ncbi:MAG: T9SS type A sorting domain-containing protein, partial [Saprospiraceae bacterium]|nr:T9SS type A sorting domain-containing protein [Saprospiraceae bacterium]